ncbi:crossover junction endodeoxyribonuclease RuvC [Leptospirillum ferriphilum]|nr:crossover junction endodeoxyribonuclease RuvC [Leptospirillum ferriphilum]
MGTTAMSPSLHEVNPLLRNNPRHAVLGVDPGLAATGFAVLEGPSLDRLRVLAQGTVRTESTLPVSRRIGLLYDRLDGLLSEYPVKGIAIEDHFSRRASPGAGLMLGPVVGIVALLADRHGVPLLPISPRELKHRITGTGAASKVAVQRALAVWLGNGLRIGSTHEGDAMGLAFLGYSRMVAP